MFVLIILSPVTLLLAAPLEHHTRISIASMTVAFFCIFISVCLLVFYVITRQLFIKIFKVHLYHFFNVIFL